MEDLSAGKAVRLSACMLERSWSWSMKISILWSMNTSFAVMLLAPNERDNRVWLSIFFLYYWWTDGEAISSREANAEFRKVNLRFWWVKTHYHEKLQKSDYACYHVNLDKPVFRDEKHVNASSRLWFHALKQSMCSIKGDCICYCLLSDIHFSSISFFLLIQFRVVGGGLETITGTKLHPGEQRANT